MLKHVEMDTRFSLQQQFMDPSHTPVVLINLFDVDPKDHDAFRDGWAEDAVS